MGTSRQQRPTRNSKKNNRINDFYEKKVRKQSYRGVVTIIIAFVGTVGSGKTLSAVYEAYKYYKYKGYTVYSNIGLKFPHIKLNRKTLDALIKEKKGLQDAVLLMDEVHISVDSRSSMSKRNKAISYFVLQTRKRNVRLLYTTQHLHQVDKF